MDLRNDEGTPIDPVPFFVVVAMLFLVCFSFGPLYGTALGAPMWAALLGSAGVFVATTAGAYQRLVSRNRPDAPRAPPEARIRHLFYVALALVGVLALLALPLL